ncbi:DUF6626 family protein [Pseudomonas pohangensis]|uniref:DUF6626 family protein n=1 Tax=Pseudomonas pohangensis TaxID=364197 RepID=UPI000B7D1BCD
MAKKCIFDIYQYVKSLGAVVSQKEFCEKWLGRSECYFRTIRHKGKEPSLAAMAACARRLDAYIEEVESAGASDADVQSLRSVQDACNKLINERIYGVARG